MQQQHSISKRSRLASIVAVVLSLAGCSGDLCRMPDVCAEQLVHCPVLGAMQEKCSAAPAASRTKGMAGHPKGCRCEGCGPVRFRDKVPKGPPPVSYKPVLPSRFLPVPVKPTSSEVNPQAPNPHFTPFEFGYQNEWGFPAGD